MEENTFTVEEIQKDLINAADTIEKVIGKVELIQIKLNLLSEEVKKQVKLLQMPKEIQITTTQEVSLLRLIDLIAQLANVTVKDITGKTRKEPVANARAVVIYLAQNLNLPEKVKAKYIKRDRTTFYHSIKKIEDQLFIEDKTITYLVTEGLKYIKNGL